MLTSKPTAITTPRTGIAIISKRVSASLPMVKTICAVMVIPLSHKAGSQRPDQQIPSVGQDEQH